MFDLRIQMNILFCICMFGVESIVVICTQTRQKKNVFSWHLLGGFMGPSINSWCGLSTVPVFCFIRDNHHGTGHNFLCTDYQTAFHGWFGLEYQQIACHEEGTGKHGWRFWGIKCFLHNSTTMYSFTQDFVSRSY